MENKSTEQEQQTASIFSCGLKAKDFKYDIFSL